MQGYFLLPPSPRADCPLTTRQARGLQCSLTWPGGPTPQASCPDAGFCLGLSSSLPGALAYELHASQGSHTWGSQEELGTLFLEGREPTTRHGTERSQECAPHTVVRGLTSRSLSPTRTPARAAGPSSDTREMKIPCKTETSPRTSVDALPQRGPQQLCEAQKPPSQGCKDAPGCRKGRSGPAVVRQPGCGLLWGPRRQGVRVQVSPGKFDPHTAQEAPVKGR